MKPEEYLNLHAEPAPDESAQLDYAHCPLIDLYNAVTENVDEARRQLVDARSTCEILAQRLERRSHVVTVKKAQQHLADALSLLGSLRPDNIETLLNSIFDLDGQERAEAETADQVIDKG
ncbi:MAG TPA: hypothetical protein VI756_15435 [Blastocatellia bacterium]